MGWGWEWGRRDLQARARDVGERRRHGQLLLTAMADPSPPRHLHTALQMVKVLDLNAQPTSMHKSNGLLI